MGAGYSEASRSLTVGMIQLLLDARLGRRGPSPATAGGAHSQGARRIARGRRVDQPSPGPAVDRAVRVDRVRARQALYRSRDFAGLQTEETRELALAGEDRAARVALDHAGDGSLA